MVARGWREGGDGQQVLDGESFSFWGYDRVLELEAMVVQCCGCTKCH